MSKTPTELKSSGNQEFDQLATLAAEAGFRVFPKTQQIVAADYGSSGSAEVSLAKFAALVEAQALARLAATLIPDFDFVHDKRMSEMTSEEQDDSLELWIRKNIGWFDSYTQEKLEFLLKRIDALRKALTAEG